MVTSIVTAALIRPLYEDGYHQIENIYLADAFADDVNEIATRYYNPEDVHLIFDDFCLRWKLKYTWDEGSWDEDYGMEQDLNDMVGILIANNVPISKEVREFMAEPFSMKRVREYYPDTKRWGTIENPKD